MVIFNSYVKLQEGIIFLVVLIFSLGFLIFKPMFRGFDIFLSADPIGQSFSQEFWPWLLVLIQCSLLVNTVGKTIIKNDPQFHHKQVVSTIPKWVAYYCYTPINIIANDFKLRVLSWAFFPPPLCSWCLLVFHDSYHSCRHHSFFYCFLIIIMTGIILTWYDNWDDGSYW